MKLRWIIRDNEKVLQYEFKDVRKIERDVYVVGCELPFKDYIYEETSEWVDVPLEQDSGFQDSLDRVNKKYGNMLKKLGDE
jgi:hypothetical protein